MDYASSLLGLIPGARRATPGLKELLATVGKYLPPEQVERIREAAEFGASAHKGQTRLSGEPYIAHPVAAAAILADLHLDTDTIIAAILHDVIEDTRRPRTSSRNASVPMSPKSSTGSPNSTRSSSRAARRRRPRASARCCSPWCATCAWCWSSSPIARTTCAPSRPWPCPAGARSPARRWKFMRPSPSVWVCMT